MNRIEKIKRNIEKAKYLWSEIGYYISSLEDSGTLVGIKTLGNRLKVSKNTIKKYVRLALEDKIKFFQYIDKNLKLRSNRSFKISFNNISWNTH